MTKSSHPLSPALIVLMSVATGLAVASNYYAQPLLDTIARAFSLSSSQTAAPGLSSSRHRPVFFTWHVTVTPSTASSRLSLPASTNCSTATAV